MKFYSGASTIFIQNSKPTQIFRKIIYPNWNFPRITNLSILYIKQVIFIMALPSFLNKTWNMFSFHKNVADHAPALFCCRSPNKNETNFYTIFETYSDLHIKASICTEILQNHELYIFPVVRWLREKWIFILTHPPFLYKSWNLSKLHEKSSIWTNISENHKSVLIFAVGG